MTRFIARSLLVFAQLGITLGNYWFTFGLWPRSWTAFFGFALLSVLMIACAALIELDKSK